MKVSLVLRAVGVAAVAAVGLTACGSNSNGGTSNGTGGSSSGCPSGTVTGQGSTFQQSMEQQWISQYTGQCSGAHITYTGVGSGAGIQQFGSGTTDYAGSDVVMISTEQAAADKACGSPAIHIPITAGGIALIYNVKGVSNLQLSAPTIAKIFTGKIKTWDDAAIKADNPGVQLPATAVKSYHRADSSGTTGVFSGFLDAVAKSDWSLGANKELSWPAGQAATGSDGVTAGVKATDGGITYAEISYAKQSNLSTAKVKGVGSGYIDLTGATVAQSLDTGFSVTGTGNNLAGALDFTKMQGYPISTVSYVIVCSKYSDATKGKVIKGLLDYAIGSGQGQADALGFAPLPTALAAKSKQSIDSIS